MTLSRHWAQKEKSLIGERVKTGVDNINDNGETRDDRFKRGGTVGE